MSITRQPRNTQDVQILCIQILCVLCICTQYEITMGLQYKAMRDVAWKRIAPFFTFKEIRDIMRSWVGAAYKHLTQGEQDSYLCFSLSFLSIFLHKMYIKGLETDEHWENGHGYNC